MKYKHGWTGRILHVNLTDHKTAVHETEPYIERFIGGRGIGAKIYWDMLSPGRDAFAPESPLMLMTGPLAATTAPSGSRWLVCGKSPSLYPENFVSANLGGYLGGELKKAGYDGIVIVGKAERTAYLSIANDRVEIKDAGHLWGLKVTPTMEAIRQELGGRTRILTTGPAGESRVRLATLASDIGGSGSSGFGAVLGAKNLKAIAVQGAGAVSMADPGRVRQLRKRIRQMTGEGYLHLYGMASPLTDTAVIRKVHCHGCPQGCWRAIYRGASGEEGVRKCQAKFFYALWDKERHGDLTEVTFRATSIINEYSLCSMELPALLFWLQQCLAQGVIRPEETGLPLDAIGTLEFVEAAARLISARQGFGDILAEGIMRASDQLGTTAQAIARDHCTQTGRGIAYGPKVFSPSALIYATEPRPATPQLHEICGPATKWAFWQTTDGAYSYVSTDVFRNIARRFWGGAAAVDYATYDGKARAAVMIQNRQYAKECLILCDFTYPIFDDASTPDHVGDPTIESQLLSAVTGIETDAEALNRIGERVFNLYRAILLAEGRRGRADDYLPESQYIEREEKIYDVFGMFNPELLLPTAGDGLVSRKGKALTREGFVKMLDEYYDLRGWDRATGFFKRETLEGLGLPEIVPVLQTKVV